MKCPICQQKLGIIICDLDDFMCFKCGMWGTEKLWQALTQAKQDLVIAKSTLEYLGYEFAPAYPEKNVIAEMRQKARNAVKHIEHKD